MDENLKIALIEGSARSNGDTRTITNYLRNGRPHWDLFDLNLMDIGHYDYLYGNRQDDFLPTIEKLLGYPVLIFVSPVYWYSVSGKIKVFMDRLSDVLDDPYKDLGRALRGKSMASVSCSQDSKLVSGFEMPLRETANYLGMTYLGHYHGWLVENEIHPKACATIDLLIENVESYKHSAR